MTFAIFFIFLISFVKGLAIAGVLSWVLYKLVVLGTKSVSIHGALLFYVLAFFPGMGVGLGITIMLMSLKYLGQFI